MAWNVKYAPGTIEARGFKGDKVVLTEKRETTGAAAKLVMRADRNQVVADGEEVAMFAVEVHDAQGRVVPITDNEVTFKVTGAGKLIGVGNGDPTDHESGQGHIAEGVLGSVHGTDSIDEDGRRNYGGGNIAGTHRGNGDDCGEGDEAASAGCGVAARSPEGFGGYGCVAASEGKAKRF